MKKQQQRKWKKQMRRGEYRLIVAGSIELVKKNQRIIGNIGLFFDTNLFLTRPLSAKERNAHETRVPMTPTHRIDTKIALTVDH